MIQVIVILSIAIVVLVGLLFSAVSHASQAWIEARGFEERAQAASRQLLRHEGMVESLLAQVQDMAAQLSTLRVEKGAEPTQAGFTPPAPPPKPYSTELQEFLAGLLTDQARTLVEEQIESMRQKGIDDEQIYRHISDGEDIGWHA